MSTTARVMITRATLHAIASVIALWVTFRLLSSNVMWIQMSEFATVWIVCGIGYFLLLYAKTYAMDRADERVRRIVRDQFMVEEMRAYQRRLRFVQRWKITRANEKHLDPTEDAGG